MAKTNNMKQSTSLSDIMWYDVNPLSTLMDVAMVMKPVISSEFDITEINGGNAN